MGYAIENISSLPFGHIIGGPLVAAIEAQAAAAKTTIDFILEVGFEPPSTAAAGTDLITEQTGTERAIGSVRNITFNYTTAEEQTNVSSGHIATASLTVPLLTIVPIPYFAIEEMTIDFMAKITEAVVSKRGTASTTISKASTKASAGWGPFKASLKGSLSSKHSSTAATTSKYQTELTMNIHVLAKQDDMPAGLAKVLEILSNIIKEKGERGDGTSG